MAQTQSPPLLPTHNTGAAAGLGLSTSIPLQNMSAPRTSSGPTTGVSTKPAYLAQGYQEFSRWMASEDDFFIFRRFESLNANTILWMQYRISELEKRLQEIHDEIEKSEKADNLKNSSFKWDEKWRPERTRIMGELSGVLLQYNQFIDAYSKTRARPRAEDRQINNVSTWLKRKAINAEEARFIEKKGDLIAINTRSRPPLGRWLERIPRLHLSKLFRAKLVPDLHVKSEMTIYSSNEKFERLTTRSIIAIGLVMLLAPMWWLEFTNTSTVRLGIITGFICAFISIMSVATSNRPFEVVAATAAYAAVLMVFMQINGNKGP